MADWGPGVHQATSQNALSHPPSAGAAVPMDSAQPGADAADLDQALGLEPAQHIAGHGAGIGLGPHFRSGLQSAVHPSPAQFADSVCGLMQSSHRRGQHVSRS